MQPSRNAKNTWTRNDDNNNNKRGSQFNDREEKEPVIWGSENSQEHSKRITL